MSPISLDVIVILVIAGGLWLHFRKPKPPAGKLVLFGVGNDKTTLYSAAEGGTAWTAVTAAGAVDMYNIHTDHQTGAALGRCTRAPTSRKPPGPRRQRPRPGCRGRAPVSEHE